VVIGFDGDFPEVASTLARRGARLVVAPSSYEVEGATTWDVLYPALALANSQWWVQSNQCGAHGSTTLLGASRIVAPTGTVVAEATRAVPGCMHPPELLVQRIDLHLAYQRDGIATLLEEGRRPALYGDTEQSRKKRALCPPPDLRCRHGASEARPPPTSWGLSIPDIGADRAPSGIDFPRYDLDRTIDQLIAFPRERPVAIGPSGRDIVF
jgi:hypothetical protein